MQDAFHGVELVWTIQAQCQEGSMPFRVELDFTRDAA